MFSSMRRSVQRMTGQSLVEFALALPLLVLLVAIAADIGRAFTAYIELGNIAREGARYGAISPATAVDSAGIRTAAVGEGTTIFGMTPTIQSTTSTDLRGYMFVRVTARLDFEPFVQFPPIPASIPIEREVTMMVLR
jgi:Flp pilus assembly protein TadG